MHATTALSLLLAAAAPALAQRGGNDTGVAYFTAQSRILGTDEMEMFPLVALDGVIHLAGNTSSSCPQGTANCPSGTETVFAIHGNGTTEMVSFSKMGRLWKRGVYLLSEQKTDQAHRTSPSPAANTSTSGPQAVWPTQQPVSSATPIPSTLLTQTGHQWGPLCCKSKATASH